MRIQRHSLISGRPTLTLRRTFGTLVDLLLWTAGIAVLEVFRPYALGGDGGDLIAICGATFYGLALASAARAGLLPATLALGRAISRLSRRFAASLAPRYAVAFRPSAGVKPLRDPALASLLVLFAILAIAFTLFGDAFLEGLLFVKEQVAYTPYLILLATMWSILGAALLLGLVASAQWIHGHGATKAGITPRLLLFATWTLGIVGCVLLPGVVPLAVLALLAWWRLAALGNRPVTPYLFCRRDPQGRPLAIPVDVFLRRAFAAIALAVLFIAALGQSGRLFEAGAPQGPFAFTGALGLLATVAAGVLMLRAGAHFRAVVGEGTPPELPLTPTLWIKADAAADPVPSALVRTAESKGWRVVVDLHAPAGGFDLVVGDAGHPRRLEVREGVSDDEIAFQIERRLNVVMRRRFWRGMKRLVKGLRGGGSAEGSGFLFCPHVWLVQGVVRDVDPKDQPARSGSLIGPAYVGPPYASVFPLRVRRYLGGVLRDLGIDIIYWEDAIRWPDLKRVFGVAFEIHDQRRAPLQERHFVGVPRVRVLIQDDQAETEHPDEGGHATPAPGHMRILLILRDRGGEEEPITPAPPGTRRKQPTYV